MLLLLVGAADPAAIKNAGEILGVSAPFVHGLNPQPAGAGRVSWFFPAGHNMRLASERVDDITHLDKFSGFLVYQSEHGLGSHRPKFRAGHGHIAFCGQLGPGGVVP